MNFRRRFVNISTVVTVTGAFVLLIFMLKHIHDNTQKRNRINSYQQLMEEISDHMQSVELAANKSGTNLYQLNRVVMQQHQQLAQKLEVTDADDIKKSAIIQKTQ